MAKYLIGAIEIDGKTLPIATIPIVGFPEEGATLTLWRYEIAPLIEGKKIDIDLPLKSKFKIVSVLIIPGDFPEVVIKPV